MGEHEARRLAELVAEEIGLLGADTPLALLEREAAALIALGCGELADAMRRADDFGAAVKAELARSWRFCRRVRAGVEGASQGSILAERVR